MQGPVEEFLPWTEYVYLWICAQPGRTYVKVGISNNPDRRSKEFSTNSPFRPTGRYICQCPDKTVAYGLEQAILRKFRAWRMQGEWLGMQAKQVEAFVAACTAIAKERVSDRVRFRAHDLRKPNGEKFKASTASDRVPDTKGFRYGGSR